MLLKTTRIQVTRYTIEIVQTISTTNLCDMMTKTIKRTEQNSQ